MFSEFIFCQIWRVFFKVNFLPKIKSLSEFIFVWFPILRNSEFDFAVFLIENK